MSGKSTEELKLEDNSEASFNQFLDRGCFDVCVDYAKHVQRQTSSGHKTRTFHNLLLLAGDVETNPGPDSKLLTELKEFRRATENNFENLKKDINSNNLTFPI